MTNLPTDPKRNEWEQGFLDYMCDCDGTWHVDVVGNVIYFNNSKSSLASIKRVLSKLEKRAEASHV